ncbi:MAG: MBL fold metallo-hydrolase [Bacteroidales bacterium]|nr:MBL fold metallo-hydrolase [Bacteroidales bacterium]
MEETRYTIHRISLVKVASYLVYRHGEAFLVDSGNSGSEAKILETLSKLGLQPGMLKLLILTHTHFDHAGSAGKLKELTGCRIMVHRSEESRLREGLTTIPGGTRWKAKLLVGLGRIIIRRLMKYPGVEPDLLAGDSFDLQEVGFPGKVIHTPGHTYGSMVVLMDGGELIAGDTLFGLQGKEHFPPFAEDIQALIESWKHIRSLPVKIMYPGHGRPITSESFLAEFDHAMKKYR